MPGKRKPFSVFDFFAADSPPSDRAFDGGYPYKSMFWTCAGNFSKGVSRSKPWATEAVARGACAVGRIEAEGARLELRNGDATIGTRELFGKSVFLAADDGDGDEATR